MIKPYLFLLFLYSLTFYSQGSGNCLLYNGTSNYTEIPDNALFSSHSGGEMTVEAWVKVVAINTDGHGQTRQPIVMKGNSGQWEWALYIYDNLSAGFSSWRCSGSSHSEISGGSIVLNQWHHIAASFDDGNFNRVYIDGVLVTSGTSFSGTACNGSRPVRIGSREDGQYLNAYIDEVKIWNRALTQTDIRNNMCQKNIGNEANLTAYYRIDEGVDNTCNATEDVCDLTANGFNGTNNNSPQWNISGAAIGDESNYLYTNSWAGQTVFLNSASKGSFEISNIANNPDGIHLYRVDEVPNSTIGITKGLGSNDVYYGTFIPNHPSGTNFTVKYDYTNYPHAINDENDLLLYARDENADLSWFDNGAILNTASNTLTSNSESIRLEYIIALSSGALPVELLNFDAISNNFQNSVSLVWATASEINNSYFEIERSIDATHWTTIEKIEALGNSNTTIEYQTEDDSPLKGVSYYRLKQADINGTFSFSPLKIINRTDNSKLNLYPNPANRFITITSSNEQLKDIIILDYMGRNVSHKVNLTVISNHKTAIEIAELSDGIYFVKTQQKTIKFLKKQ